MRPKKPICVHGHHARYPTADAQMSMLTWQDWWYGTLHQDEHVERGMRVFPSRLGFDMVSGFGWTMLTANTVGVVGRAITGRELCAL